MRNLTRFQLPILLLLILTLALSVYLPELNRDDLCLPDGKVLLAPLVAAALLSPVNQQSHPSRKFPETPGHLPHPPPAARPIL